MKIKKTMHGDYETEILFPVFSNYHVLVVLTEDFQKSWNSRFTSTVMTVAETQAFHWHQKPNEGHSRLFFKVGNCASGVVAHECWHCIRTMLTDWVGCGLEDEVVAYHLDYLVQAVTDFKNQLIDQGIKSSTKKR